MNGIVLEYYEVRRFGYLKDEDKDEYCFYSSDVQTNVGLLKKGDQVEFDLYRGHGVRAINVRKNSR